MTRDGSRLFVAGYSEAAMYLRQCDEGEVAAVLSIRGQREHAVDADGIAHTVLEFDDVEPPDKADPLSASRLRIRQRLAAANGLRLRPPTIDDARVIVDFAERHASADGVVVLHCHAGISRSTAAALIVLAAWMGAGHERACVEQLRLLRPAAVPMRGLVRLGDQVLGREGRLINAVTA